MIHSINQNFNDFSNTSFVIPEDQIIFGTKQFQNAISNDYLKRNNKVLTTPQIYLTKALNDTFNSALSTVYNNNSISSRINIINGLDVSLLDTFIVDNSYLKITINPGNLIMDGVLIRISNNIELRINIPYDSVFVNKQYDHILISAEYMYDLNESYYKVITRLDGSRQRVQKTKFSPIKLVAWLYDSNTGTLFNDQSQVWNDNQFVYKTIAFQIDSNLIFNFYPCSHEHIIINGKSYSTQFYNYYQWMYIRILLEMFDSFNYFLDLPFIPPVPKSLVYGTTGIFL